MKSGGNIEQKDRKYIANQVIKITMLLIAIFAAIGMIVMAEVVITNITERITK